MNWPNTALTERLRIRYPIVQAPVTDEAATPELVAAVANAGGLGSLVASALTPEQIRSAIAAVRARTEQPFAVNLMAAEPTPAEPAQLERAQELLAPYRAELQLPPPLPPPPLPSLDEQLVVVMEEQVAAVSFSCGIPNTETLDALRESGIVTLAVATHLLEGILLEESGIDFVIAQGAEASGQRGSFIGNAEQGLVGTMALTPLLVNYLRIPVLTSGGVSDGRGVAAALALGAAGAQLGSAFLASTESSVPRKYKELLCSGAEIATVLTRVFSGRLGRVLKNRLVTELQAHEHELPGYPLQEFLTRDIRTAAARQDRPELMALWAGQGCNLCQSRSVADLMAEWIAQVETILSQ